MFLFPLLRNYLLLIRFFLKKPHFQYHCSTHFVLKPEIKITATTLDCELKKSSTTNWDFFSINDLNKITKMSLSSAGGKTREKARRRSKENSTLSSCQHMLERSFRLKWKMLSQINASQLQPINWTKFFRCSKKHFHFLKMTKQVLRSTILSSTIILIFFNNWRMGRF